MGKNSSPNAEKIKSSQVALPWLLFLSPCLSVAKAGNEGQILEKRFAELSYSKFNQRKLYTAHACVDSPWQFITQPILAPISGFKNDSSIPLWTSARSLIFYIYINIILLHNIYALFSQIVGRKNSFTFSLFLFPFWLRTISGFKRSTYHVNFWKLKLTGGGLRYDDLQHRLFCLIKDTLLTIIFRAKPMEWLFFTWRQNPCT